MRALERWSASSFTTTVPKPCQGEPSRRISGSLVFARLLLEEARIDRVQARVIDRQPAQRAVGRHHGPRRLRTYVAIGGEAVAVMARALDRDDARHRVEARHEVGRRIRFHLDHETRAENLAR